MSGAPEIIEPVDPARLESGQWCHRLNKTIGQGDISASCSSDRIGMGQPIRKPFEWKGALWVCAGIRYMGGTVTAHGYRLVHPQMFDGTPTSYAQKTKDSAAARNDPNGFYHGMRVRHAGAEFILCGPEVHFVQGETEQLALF